MRIRVRVSYRLHGCIVAFLLVLVAPVRSGRADEKPPEIPLRQATYVWDRSLLRTSFTYREAFTAPVVQKLSRGLSTIIAMRAYVLPEGDDRPVALAVRTCRIAYDLWDEVYRVTIDDPPVGRELAVLNVEGVLRQCTEVHDLPMAERSIMQVGTRYYLGVIVEVNPVSPQMLEQMRRWVSRPTGSTGIGAGDALFASFVGLFVRQIGVSDLTLRFRTQPFVPPDANAR